MVTLEYLKERLSYDPETGEFTWLSSRRKDLIGKVAGSKDIDGYIVIRVLGHQFKAHRLAWYFVHGVWPHGLIDHRDNVKSNNRIANLRDASYSLNNRNVPLKRSNSSGHKGVSWHKGAQKWRSTIKINHKQVHLGFFKCLDEAALAYQNASQVLLK